MKMVSFGPNSIIVRQNPRKNISRRILGHHHVYWYLRPSESSKITNFWLSPKQVEEPNQRHQMVPMDEFSRILVRNSHIWHTNRDIACIYYVKKCPKMNIIAKIPKKNLSWRRNGICHSSYNLLTHIPFRRDGRKNFWPEPRSKLKWRFYVEACSDTLLWIFLKFHVTIAKRER